MQEVDKLEGLEEP